VFVRLHFRSHIALHSSLFVLALWAGTASAADEESLKGDAKQIDDITATPLTIDAKGLLPCLAWADDKSSSFYALDGDGVLRLISFPDFKVLKKKDFERKMSWLSVSADGLVLSVPDKHEVWLVDGASWEVKKQLDVPHLQRAVSAPSSAVVVASAGDGPVASLYVLDFKAGKANAFTPPEDAQLLAYNGPVMTPDGKHVLTQGVTGQICRFRVDNRKVKYDDQGEPVASGAAGAGLQVSPDSKFVCLPTGGGNVGKNYATFVFPVTDLKKPECSVESGAYPRAVGFDPAAGWIYAQNFEHPLLLFTLTGVKKKEYKIGTLGGDVRQFLVHPAGNTVLILGESKIYSVDTPKKS
jgi:hypothetical protein